jgi:hypothetical protein
LLCRLRRRLALGDSSQRGEIASVLFVVVAFRRFENGRPALETLVPNEILEGGDAELAVADVRVAIDVAAKPFLRIVQMNDLQAIKSNHIVKGTHCLRVLVSITNVIARDEDMACIQAYSDP